MIPKLPQIESRQLNHVHKNIKLDLIDSDSEDDEIFQQQQSRLQGINFVRPLTTFPQHQIRDPQAIQTL